MGVENTNVTVDEEALKQFTAGLLKAMQDAMSSYGIAELEMTSTPKTNIGLVDGITAKFSDGNTSPNVYPSAFYEAYENGTSIDEIAKNALATMKAAHENMSTFDLSSINPENAKDHLYMVVVNREMNPELAEKACHIDQNDLMGVPRWRVSMSDGESASILVTHELQSQMLHMTDDEVLQMAKQNTISEGFTIKGMNEVMMEMMGADLPEEFIAEMMPPEEQMYVVSNEQKLNGATALLDKQTLEQVKEKIGEDNFYVIPSSLHEVLIVPESKVSDPHDLKQMCEEVNATQVAPQDKLGDNIYRYDGEKRKLSICNNLEQLKQQTMPVDLTKVEVGNHISSGRKM